jgi:hypothetical protein
MVADYLTALPFKERTKANHRDTIGFFNRWLVLRGFLVKGTDWLEGVQNTRSGNSILSCGSVILRHRMAIPRHWTAM